MPFKNTAEFDFQSTGDVTQQQYMGRFEVKIHLSVSEQLTSNRRKKELLPKDWVLDSKDVNSIQMDNQAEVLAVLPIRIVRGPDWWTGSRAGQDLVDENILYELYQRVMEVFTKDIEERAAKAKGAAEELAKKTT